MKSGKIKSDKIKPEKIKPGEKKHSKNIKPENNALTKAKTAENKKIVLDVCEDRIFLQIFKDSKVIKEIQYLNEEHISDLKNYLALKSDEKSIKLEKLPVKRNRDKNNADMAIITSTSTNLKIRMKIPESILLDYATTMQNQ